MTRLCFEGCDPSWILCFRKDCPRAAYLRQQQAEAMERARKFLGSQAVGISFPSGEDGQHTRGRSRDRQP